jgi:hypothetical protein
MRFIALLFASLVYSANVAFAADGAECEGKFDTMVDD